MSTRYFETSTHFPVDSDVTEERLKEDFLNRMQRFSEFSSIGDSATLFDVRGTTGVPASLTRHSRIDLQNSIHIQGGVARITVSGYVRHAKSLVVLYFFLFFIALLIGLLPGSIETSLEDSGAIDALVFLILGMYIVYDINRKLSEPQALIAQALNTLETLHRKH